MRFCQWYSLYHLYKHKIFYQTTHLYTLCSINSSHFYTTLILNAYSQFCFSWMLTFFCPGCCVNHSIKKQLGDKYVLCSPLVKLSVLLCLRWWSHSLSNILFSISWQISHPTPSWTNLMLTSLTKLPHSLWFTVTGD